MALRWPAAGVAEWSNRAPHARRDRDGQCIAGRSIALLAG